MKPIPLLFFLISFVPAKAQNIILPEGEFMDTTQNINPQCGDYFGNYYYGFNAKYPKSSATLLHEVQAFLQEKSNKYEGSGYITFRFMIDCEGKMLQKVQVLQTDEHYLDYHFDKGFVNQLFGFCKSLNQWKKVSYESGEPANYMAFISFKIKNGKVINIIP